MSWAKQDCKSRAKALHQVATEIKAADMSGVARLMTLEPGKSYPESIGEIANIPPVFRYYAEMAREVAGKVPAPCSRARSSSGRTCPTGSLCTSPAQLPAHPRLLVDRGLTCRGQRGHPQALDAGDALRNGVHALLPPAARWPGRLPSRRQAVGKMLIDCPGTHAVAFTGSARAGQMVAMDAARARKPAVIKAGGSDPFIVSDRADIPVAAAAVTAAFLQSGQVCTSAKRFFVVDSVHDRFVEEFVTRARRLRIGGGMGVAEIGPLVSEQARQRIGPWSGKPSPRARKSSWAGRSRKV